MALVVGELVGFIRLDDGEVRPALNRAEGQLNASGRRMASDAERSGQQAGQALGDGLVRGADGRIRDARGRFVAAGRTLGNSAGDAVGDGLQRGTAEGADDAVNAAEGGLSRLQMIAGAAGVAAGAALMVGMQQMLEQDQITGRLGAQMGKTPAEAQRYGKIAGKLYADAITQDFQGAADAISATMAAGLVPPDATNAQIQSIATNVSDLSSTFELDLGQAANAVGQIMKTGLAPNAKTALDVMTRGMQVMGPRADDLADTFNEYSTIFRQLGVDAGQVTGIMAQGMAAGARDTDVVADSLKELVLITQGGGEEVDKAFKKIGLSGKTMQSDFSKGGPAARAALDQIFDGLRKVKDPADRSAIALTLFGTKSEDMQKALFAIDPSKAVGALGATAGAADKAGNTLRNNAGTKVEAFKRSLQQGIVNVLGTQVIPALLKFGQWAQQNSGTVKILASIIGGILIPVLILMGINATMAAGRMVIAWTTSGAAALRSAGTQIAAGARVVAAWVMLGVQSMIQGARMAAAWIIAMGPVGWVIAGIIALAALIWANWDNIKKYTLMAWDWVWGKIQGIGVAIVGFFLKWNIIAIFLRHWDAIRTGVATKAVALINWVRGLPGRISAGIGSLTSLLTDKGRNIVQGLWNGIQGMGGWLKGKIMGWAKSVVPGPIAKAMGISSPSKVTAAQGRWIGRGLATGLTGTTKQVRGAATKLADVVRDSLSGKGEAKALSRVKTGTKSLVSLATADEKVAARLKAASKSVADQITARNKLAADVKKGVLDSANITSGGSEAVSAESILTKLTDKLGQARTFALHLAALRKKGVRGDLIAQIAQAGVEQGSGAAAALASASGNQVKAINSTQAQLVTAAGQAGNTAGNAMYGAGIQAAQGLVQGLRSQQSAIDRQMALVAKSMTTAIKRALGIRSPSRLMDTMVGRYIPAGIIQGIRAGTPALDRTMSNLVSTPAVGTPAVAMSSGGSRRRGSTGGRGVLELRSSGNRMDNMLLDLISNAVRVKGGDFDVVMPGR